MAPIGDYLHVPDRTTVQTEVSRTLDNRDDFTRTPSFINQGRSTGL